MGLVLLVAGIVLVAFPTEESYNEEKRNSWNVVPPVLPPLNHTFYGKFMKEGNWFQLNITSSDPVRVTISAMEQGEVPTSSPIFGQVGTRFTQKVLIGGMATYNVEIRNEGSAEVQIEGNVDAVEVTTKYRVVYPYSSLGALAAIAGVGALTLGVFTKQKRHIKQKKTIVKKKQS